MYDADLFILNGLAYVYSSALYLIVFLQYFDTILT